MEENKRLKVLEMLKHGRLHEVIAKTVGIEKKYIARIKTAEMERIKKMEESEKGKYFFSYEIHGDPFFNNFNGSPVTKKRQELENYKKKAA